jgi:hypothetical protein
VRFFVSLLLLLPLRPGIKFLAGQRVSIRELEERSGASG